MKTPNWNKDYKDNKLVRNEELSPVERHDLKSTLHRSMVALTFVNGMRKLCVGSGVLISPNLVLTAAHNVYDKNYQSEHDNFKVYQGADGVAKKYYEVESKRYLPAFKDCPKSGRIEFDYALLKLKDSIPFDRYMPLSAICEHCLMENNNQTALQIYGFPD
jgi:V8-like Glu-specific endopeptidase